MKAGIRVLLAMGLSIGCLPNPVISYADDVLDDFPLPLGAKWAQLYPEASGRSIVATSSGYVVAGRQNGPPGSSSLDHWTILVRYSTDGTSSGSNTFHLDPDHNEAFDILASYDGTDTLDGYIITGAKHQEFIENGHEYYDPYMWIMKTGTNLERMWETTFGDPFGDHGYSAFNDGNGFIFSGKYSNPNESAYLVRTDESGGMTWEASWGTTPRWEFLPVIFASAPAIGGGLVVATDSGLHKLGPYTVSDRPSDTPVWSASGSDILRSVVAVSDGYVATGHVDVAGEPSHADLVLIKVNEDGSIAWRHTFGRSAPALGADGMNDYGNEVIQTADGGFAIIGSTQSYAWHGGTDMWLLKTDANGVMAWDIVAGDSDSDSGHGIVQDSANDLVVCGTATYDDGLGAGLTSWMYTAKFSDSYAPPSPSFTYSPQSPFFIEDQVNFDASGSSAGGTGNSLILYEWDFGDGNSGTGITAHHTYLSPGTYTATLYVTDNNGIRRETSQVLTALGFQTQWEREFGNGHDWFYDLAEGDGDNLLLCGINCITVSNCSTWAVKVDQYGNTIWGNTYPDTYPGGRDSARKAILGHDDNYLVAGFRDKGTAGTTRDVRILKIDAATGVKIWDKSYDYAEGLDEAMDIKPVPTGGYIVAGYASVTTSPVDMDIWLMKLDEDGDLVWDETYSNSGVLFLKGSAVTPVDDGGFLVLGTRWGSFSNQPIIAIKVNSTGVEQWRRTILNTGTKTTGVTWVHQKANGDFAIAGTLNDDYALITLGEDGLSHDVASWGTSYDRDFINDADTTREGGYVVAGTQFTEENDDDTYLARLDSQGNVLWDMTIGEPGVGGENGQAVAYLSGGSVVLLHTDYYGGVTRLTKLGPEVLPTLVVYIEPQAAMDDGARWRRAGTTPWLESGADEVGLPPGDHAVEFRAVAGWDTPAQRMVTVEAGGTAFSTGIYAVNESLYHITVGTGTPGGAVLGAGVYLHNELVTLTAEPDRGYRFLYWTENGEIVSGESALTFLATEERELTAHFERAGTLLPGVRMLLLEDD